MRDPEGRLTFAGDLAVRALSRPSASTPFLHGATAQAMVSEGLLVPYQFTELTRIESPRYAFVTHPTDWCDAQHHAAAQLTLAIARRVFDDGFELKDASAWNIVFEGSQPRFCDHLSFQPVASREWWAFGQFCRHFTFPLASAKWRGIRASDAFRMYRDGIPAERARHLFGVRGLASRLLPLLWRLASVRTEPTVPVTAPAFAASKALHRSLIDYAQHTLLEPVIAGNKGQCGPWAGYVADRRHYSEPAAQAKHDQVRQWLGAARPSCVLDLGCNTGEFSRLAIDVAQRVIAVDSDHDCVQALYIGANGDPRLYPVLADLGDMHGGRGWDAKEAAGLLDRLEGQADMTLMLALIHHLHCSEGIPLPEIAALAARLTKRDLIVELLEPQDEMVQKLASQRRLALDGFSLKQQLHAFDRHFELLGLVSLPTTRRHLALMRRRS